MSPSLGILAGAALALLSSDIAGATVEMAGGATTVALTDNGREGALSVSTEEADVEDDEDGEDDEAGRFGPMPSKSLCIWKMQSENLLPLRLRMTRLVAKSNRIGLN